MHPTAPLSLLTSRDNHNADRMHCECALALIGCGYDLLLEKPMAPSEAECEVLYSSLSDTRCVDNYDAVPVSARLLTATIFPTPVLCSGLLRLLRRPGSCLRSATS
jgi:hypothetical protein